MVFLESAEREIGVKLFWSCGFFVAAIASCLVSRAEFANAGALSAASAIRIDLHAIRLHATRDGNAPLAGSRITLRTERSSPLDLEVGGELAGMEKGATRYISREDLLALPQVTFTAAGDGNFVSNAEIRGVTLAELAKHLGESPDGDLVVAICDDLYRANYSREYIAAHQPVLVLEINGKAPEGWPKDPEGHGESMGPYMISHDNFKPSFKILSHSDTAQIPWGVVRLEFRNEKNVFASIAPRGAAANSAAVQDGFRIAKQNCFPLPQYGSRRGTTSGSPVAGAFGLGHRRSGFFPRIRSQSQIAGFPFRYAGVSGIRYGDIESAYGVF